MAKKFVLKRGLKNLYAAEILYDDNETSTAGTGETPNHGYVTGTPFRLTLGGEMTRTVENEKNDVYFDDVVFDTVGMEGATEITITGPALRPQDLAKINNKYISTSGAIIDSGEFNPKYFALGGETENTDGTSEMFWFAKGTFSIPERADKTKDNTTDTNGMTLTFSAVQTEHLFTVDSKKVPHKCTTIDTSTTQLKSSKTWAAQVVTPENESTIIELITGSSDDED